MASPGQEGRGGRTPSSSGLPADMGRTCVGLAETFINLSFTRVKAPAPGPLTINNCGVQQLGCHVGEGQGTTCPTYQLQPL